MKLDLHEVFCMFAWNGLVWLRIGTDGGFL
jgi:hypothetical protein